jgi:1-acyl-sn-glycerol-3-phosphate acyltransferase
MPPALRRALLNVVFRPFAKLFLGLDVVGRDKLPKAGPAIVVANHNSHLDTLILLCLFPSKLLEKVRPAAAADHFLKTKLSSWFSREVVGIIPVKRGGGHGREDVLGECKEALARGDILVIFPEGSRGEPEQLGEFKGGVARLAAAFPEAPVTPVYIQGAGRTLPKDSKLLVPYNCTAIVGDPIAWSGDRRAFMTQLREAIERLKALAPPLRWR